MFQQTKLYWRFDDLNFSETFENFPAKLLMLRKLVKSIENSGGKATFALIPRYNEKTYKDNPAYLRYTKKLIHDGHTIAIHGLRHENWKKLSLRKCKQIIFEIQQDLIGMDITTNVFVFPGLQTRWLAIPLLKKAGFDIIIKGENYSFPKRFFVRIANWFFSTLYNVSFFIPHNWSTELSYSPPRLKSFDTLEKLSKEKKVIHIMDHAWLHNEQSINAFNVFLKKNKPLLYGIGKH